jgi:16S rRNA (uracil1498-N3)-methyltransferase
MRWVLAPEATLDEDKTKHLRKVLRMEWGEAVLVTDGNGRLREGTFEKSGDLGVLKLGSVIREEPTPAPVVLAICLPKNATMDWVVEKSVECGVTKVVPIISSRSVVRPKAADASKYVRRWQAIMDGAVEQSERLWRPEVLSPQPWNTWMAGLAKDAGDLRKLAFVSELRSERGDTEALTFSWQAVQGLSGVCVLVGPEGGLSDEERSDLGDHGFQALSLGRSVLRVETAVVSVLTLVRLSRCIAPHV